MGKCLPEFLVGPALRMLFWNFLFLALYFAWVTEEERWRFLLYLTCFQISGIDHLEESISLPRI